MKRTRWCKLPIHGRNAMTLQVKLAKARVPHPKMFKLEVASDHGDLCHHLVETFVSIKRLGLRDVFGAWVSK